MVHVLQMFSEQIQGFIGVGTVQIFFWQKSKKPLSTPEQAHYCSHPKMMVVTAESNSVEAYQLKKKQTLIK